MKKICHRPRMAIGHGIMRVVLVSLGLTALSSCGDRAPMPTVGSVDLNRFMGRWYVIAHIPTFMEKTAHNAIETYRLSGDGTIETRFAFNDGAPDGPSKVYTAKGFVQNTETNALWKMQFIWPFKAEYRIVYLSEEYSLTMIGRSKRDYLWVMARRPAITDKQYQQMNELAKELGYDTRQIRRVPQVNAAAQGKEALKPANPNDRSINP